LYCAIFYLDFKYTPIFLNVNISNSFLHNKIKRYLFSEIDFSRVKKAHLNGNNIKSYI
jgi:hypothetical protein